MDKFHLSTTVVQLEVSIYVLSMDMVIFMNTPHFSCFLSDKFSFVILMTLLHKSHSNLGPDRLAGPKALDPNYCKQSTL